MGFDLVAAAFAIASFTLNYFQTSCFAKSIIKVEFLELIFN